MPKLDDVDSGDDILHEESKVKLDAHAADQANGELLDDVEEKGGKGARKQAEAAQEDDDEASEGEPLDEEEFEVEEIISHKFIKNEIHYHIHWKGYNARKDYTWEPTDNILPGAREKLADYHDKIGGEPVQNLRKAKSSQSLRRQSSTDDSPAPKKRKIEESDDYVPKRQDWEPEVEKIDTIERDANGQLIVFVRFINGRGLKCSMDMVYKHCPRPMLRFYENHLHFKSVEAATAPGP